MNSSRTERVLQVLNLVVLKQEPVKLKTIGETLGLHPSMVSRIVDDLISGGLLAKCTYRSVIATPALALLGKRAGENHPLARIAEKILPEPLEKMGLQGDLAVLELNSFYHFFRKWENLPPVETVWNSDAAAVILAAETEEKAEEKLLGMIPEEHAGEIPRLMERIREVNEKHYLVDFHAGRFWQLTFPVQCGAMNCAFSVARIERPADDLIFFECSRLVARMQSAYDNWKNSLC